VQLKCLLCVKYRKNSLDWNILGKNWQPQTKKERRHRSSARQS